MNLRAIENPNRNDPNSLDNCFAYDALQRFKSDYEPDWVRFTLAEQFDLCKQELRAQRSDLIHSAYRTIRRIVTSDTLREVYRNNDHPFS